MSVKNIEFPKKNYQLERELGQGACGRTVLLYDKAIDERFACKKYDPSNIDFKEELFSNFVREIKILYKLNHPNIVRVFSYDLYPDKHVGYILMEYVDGTDISSFLRANPDDVNNIFQQTVEGFFHLEENEILHRDIRPLNLMIANSGTLKIIDFGFGKNTRNEADFGKSITLNWWCEAPQDFEEGLYNFSTEVYFIGKLYEKIISENNIKNFKYSSLLKKMCHSSSSNRISSFSIVKKEILVDQFLEADFSDDELYTYRKFSDALFSITSKIEQGAKFKSTEDIQNLLENYYKRNMLENELPNNSELIRCFFNGGFYFNVKERVYVSTLKNFIDVFRNSSLEKKNIIISNLQSKLDAVKRYDATPTEWDDVPF